MLPDYSLCDSDATPNNGYTTFDLTSTIPMILSGLNPATHTITFHPSDTDSTNNTNAIVNPSSYTNSIPNTQLIGVRIVDNNTSQVYLAAMNLVVVPMPTANAAQLTYYYEPFELNMFYMLPMADSQITGGITGVTVIYYPTLADAYNQSNAINTSNSYIPTVIPGVEILYARVTNDITGCFSITTLTLNTLTINGCPTPTNLVASQMTDTSFALSWTSGGPVGYSLACLVPLGAPPSDNGAVITSTGPAPYIFTGLMPNTCYDVYVKAVCSPTASSQWSAPLTVCMPDCANTGNCSQALVLTAFLDSNNNGVKDTGEVNFNNGNFVYQINDSGTNLYGNSNEGSYYIFDSNPSNSYDISFSVNTALGAYYTSSVTHNNVTLPSSSGANNLYFPIVNIQPFVDAKVSLYPSGQPRPGFTYGNVIYYKNNGSQTMANGTLTFTKDSNLSITSISQLGTTPTANGFTYDFTNLAPFEVRYIVVTLAVPTIPTVNLGDIVTNTVSVQTNNDADASNNTSTLSQIVVGSYDPNEKSEAHGGKIGLDTFTNNDYLYYTINFENTGTASAEFIRVEDALGSDLDESTFEMINASHTVNTKREGNQLTWHFYNINLPPTVSNPNNSHGYVYFKIKPKTGYAVGDIIPNTASIYFDYNPAIVTNTFDTEFFTTLGIRHIESGNFVISPNPANNNVQVILQNTSETIDTILITDVLGKTIRKVNNVSGNQSSIDVSNLSQGVYFIEVTTENNLKQIKKLVIE
jgi:hypothetical protein